MIETYAFLAMFALQILVGSVLSPAWLIRRVRAKVASSAERFAELFPGVDHQLSTERFATRHRALNTGIALVGLLLLGWLFIHMRRPDWNQGKVPLLLTAYLIAQMLPLVFISAKAARINKAFKSSLADGKRKAVLQRRGLFDFVSPFSVFLAILSYILFAALVLYIRQHPFPGFGGLTNLAVITPVCALNALIVYGCLYGRNRNPVATHEDRLYAIGVIVKSCVYACIAVTLFASLTLTLSLLHLRKWELFAVSVFFVITTLICSLGVIPRRRPGDVLGSDRPLPPSTPDVQPTTAGTVRCRHD
jgi:hypothetical protein